MTVFKIEMKIGNDWEEVPGVEFDHFAPVELWMKQNCMVSYRITKRDGLRGAVVRVLCDGAVFWPVEKKNG